MSDCMICVSTLTVSVGFSAYACRHFSKMSSKHENAKAYSQPPKKISEMTVFDYTEGYNNGGFTGEEVIQVNIRKALLMASYKPNEQRHL